MLDQFVHIIFKITSIFFSVFFSNVQVLKTPMDTVVISNHRQYEIEPLISLNASNSIHFAINN